MFRHLPSAALLVVLLLGSLPALAGSGSGSVRVEPSEVQIGVCYSGQRLSVRATTPSPRKIVMRLTSADEPLTLKKKGKKYGLIWRNMGDVHFTAVPTVYLLRSSCPLEQIAAPETLERMKLGFDGVRRQCLRGSDDAPPELFAELVKLKQKDHLFDWQAGGIQIQPADAGRQEAVGEFLLPAKAPVGDYTVDVFAFQGGKGELIGTANVRLRRGAAVSAITDLAANHGLLYGCLAVAVAVLAGLSTGLVFGR